MAKCELLAALEEAKAKGSLTEISDEFLLNLVHSALSFDNTSLDKEEVADVLNGKYIGVSSEKVRLITNQKNAFLRIVEMAKENIKLTEDELKESEINKNDTIGNPTYFYKTLRIGNKKYKNVKCCYFTYPGIVALSGEINKKNEVLMAS